MVVQEKGKTTQFTALYGLKDVIIQVFPVRQLRGKQKMRSASRMVKPLAWGRKTYLAQQPDSPYFHAASIFLRRLPDDHHLVLPYCLQKCLLCQCLFISCVGIAIIRKYTEYLISC